jgi:hypothetical protein
MISKLLSRLDAIAATDEHVLRALDLDLGFITTPDDQIMEVKTK